MTEPGFDLTGKRALVTGASSGIGEAVAKRLAAAGATVVGVSRRGTVPTTDRLVGLEADLTVAEELDAVVASAVALVGGLDIVVNNAGMADWFRLGDLTRARFDAMVSLNLWAPLRLCALAHPYLAVGDDSAVVMIGSVDAVRPSAGGVVYGATKAGLAAATVAMAKEWATDRIRVTQVDPGLVDTPMAAVVVDGLEADGTKVNLVGGPGMVDQIAALVHYLVAPAGRFANATSFRVDGGALAMGPFDGWQAE